MNKLFFIHPSMFAIELVGLLKDCEVTYLLFKGSADSTYSNKTFSNMKEIRIKKWGKGKFGVSSIPNLVDYLYYTLNVICRLPQILSYDKIIFVVPPYFDCVITPYLQWFKKPYFLIMIDAQEVSQSFDKPMTWYRKLYYALSKKIEMYAVKHATMNYPTSLFLQNKYLRLTNNTQLTPNGANVAYIDKILPERSFEEFTITCLGSFEHYRGSDLLVDAFKILKKYGVSAKLLLIGDGPDAKEVKDKALGDNDIKLTGMLPYDKAVALCKGSDVLVMPARKCIASETISSTKCFIYIACEVPSVVTDTGDHAFWAKKTETGIIVDDTPEGIARGLLELYQNKKRYEELRQNCVKNKKMIDYLSFKKEQVELITK